VARESSGYTFLMPVLAGIRLVSLALNVPGPVAVARLVDDGASAWKVEPPAGDPLAAYSRPWYDHLHAGVQVDAIDLKTDDGRRALDARLQAADVVITSQRPAALARLGLAPETLAARYPRLRVVAIVGDSAAPDAPGHDLTYQAAAGLVGPAMPPTLLADLAGAEQVVSAVLLVLREGPGARRVVGLRDALETFAMPRRLGLTVDGGPLGGGDPAYRLYATRDGRAAVAALEPHFRQRLYAALGLPLDAPLDETFSARTSAEWMAFAAAHDLPLHAAAD
jgi:alpha-methylacyl-CoA racemase